MKGPHRPGDGPDDGIHINASATGPGGNVYVALGNQYILGSPVEPVPLTVAIPDYDPALAELRLEDFTGREWLIGQISDLTTVDDSGAGRYILVTARAGLGKTALAAELSRRWDCVRHFTRADGGQTRSALQSLAAQLVIRYGLEDDFAPGGVLAAWTGSPAYFPKILAAAAERARADGGQVRIVVDALDEATEGDGVALGLPVTLPAGVVVIATCREGTPAHRVPAGERVSTVRITANDPANLDDIRRFLAARTREETIAARLADAGIDESEFVASLTARCGGVWVYLRYVLSRMRVGPWSKEDMDRLPDGLVSYYRQQLASRHSEVSFHSQDLVVLSTLAVAGQPLTLDQLGRVTGLAGDAVRMLCNSRYRPFLAVEHHGVDRPQRYSIYHASLREFLHGQAATTSESDPLADDLREAVRDSHRRIADHYVAAFGGLSSGLRELHDHPELADLDERYALRHLAAHLRAASRYGDLHLLLTCHTGTPSSTVWATAHDRAGTLDDFLTQVDMAREIAERTTDSLTAHGRPAAESFAAETHYTLVVAHLISRANVIPASLVSAFVRTGVWDIVRALAHSRRLHDPAGRAAALTALLPHLTEPVLAARVCRDAHSAATAIGDHEKRAQALTALITHLDDPDRSRALDEALDAVSAMMDQFRASALGPLLPHLDDDRRHRVLTMIAGIGASQAQAHALVDLVPHLRGSALDQARQLALRATSAESMVDDWARPWALAEQAMRFAEPDRTRLLDEALDCALAIGDKHAWDRAKALAVIAPKLRGNQLDRALDAALVLASATWSPPFALGELAPLLDDTQLERALDAASTITTADNRGDALAGLLPRLDGVRRFHTLGQALDAATAITDDTQRLMHLVRLVPHIDGPARVRTLSQILDITESSATRKSPEAWALAEVAEYLSAAQFDRALDLMACFGRGESTTKAWDALAPHLDATRLRRALAIVTTTNDDTVVAELLAGVAPYLNASQLDQALGLVAVMTDIDGRVAMVLAQIGGESTHPDDVFPISYDTATLSGDEWPQVRALGALAPHCDPSQLDRAIGIARSIREGEAAVKVLARLCAYRDLTEQALDIATGIVDDWPRVRALEALAPMLRTTQLDKALDLADALDDQHLQAKALVALAPHLDAAQLDRGLAIAHRITNRWSRVQALTGVAPRLAEPARTTAVTRLLNLVASLRSDGFQATALTALAPNLTPSEINSALSIVSVMRDENDRGAALTGLVPHLHGATRTHAQQHALHSARMKDNVVSRISALAKIAAHLVDHDRTRTLDQALEDLAGVAETSTLPVPDLVPLLDADQRERTLRIITGISNESTREYALTALAPHLDAGLLDQALRVALTLPDQLAGEPRFFHHQLGGAVCVAIFTRLGALAESVTPAQTIALLRGLFRALPPRGLLLAVTGTAAAATARAVGSEAAARQFSVLTALSAT